MLETSLINGRYRVVRPLGQGGMGTVSLVEDLREAGRLVALKVFRRQAKRNDEVELFQHEFLLLSSLHHPNLADVHDFGVVEATGDVFFTTEFVDGEDLWEASASFGWAEHYEAIAQICRGLSYIHGRRLVHQDVKPGNLLVRKRPDSSSQPFTVKLIDFGLAGRVEDLGQGTIRGTVSYIAPEVGRSGPVDRRADLYSLGVTLYHCVTRELPFQGETSLEVLRAHLHAPPPDPRTKRPDLPEPFARLILDLLAKDPADRFASAEEVIAALNRLSGQRYEVETAAGAIAAVQNGRCVGRDKALSELRSRFSSTFEAASEWLESSGVFEAIGAGTLRRAEPVAPGGERFIIVTGEGGIGKSRLLREFRHVVQLARVSLVEGRAEPGSDSYAPIIEVLRAILGSWRGHLTRPQDPLRRRLLRRHGAELAKLLPELAGEAIGEAPEALAPSRERLRLFDHMTRFLLDYSRSRPLVIYLHDLHNTDEATAAFLEYFARNIELARRGDGSPAKLLVLATWRLAEAEGRAVGQLGELLESRREAARIHLERLTREELAEVIASMLGAGQASAELVEAVYAETRGNPYFVVEVLRSLIERGQLRREHGRWRLESGDEGLSLPSSVRGVIIERLARLKTEEREPLQLLAIYGRALTAPRFAELIGRPVAEVVGILEGLVRKQILDRIDGPQERGYGVIHDLVTEAVVAEIPEADCERLHLKCGDFLEAQPPGRGSENPGELARHFEAAGDAARALSYAVKAADAARSVHANERAIAFYERALGLLGDERQDPRRAQLLEHLGRVQVLVGDYASASESFSAILDLSLPALERGRLHRLRGEVCEKRGDYEGALADFSRGLRVLGKEVQSQQGAKLLAATGSIYVKKALYDTAIAFCESGLDLLSGFPESEDTASIHMILGAARAHKGDLRAAARDFEFSLELRQRARNRLGIAQTLTRLGGVALELGEVEGAVESFERALELHEGLGHRQGVAEAATHLGRALALLGESERAILLHRRALTIKERIGDLEGIVMTHNDLGALMLERADYGDAALSFRLALETNAGLGEVYESVRAHLGQAELAGQCGLLEGASESASEALRLATVHAMTREQGLAYGLLGRIAAQEGDTDRAERLMHRAISVLTRTEGKPDEVGATLDLIDLYVLRGDGQLAGMAYDKLNEVGAALTHRRLRARAALTGARVAASRGQSEAAQEQASLALQEARAVGDRELAWQALALIGDEQARTGEAPAAMESYVAAMEVLRGIYTSLDSPHKEAYLGTPARRALKESFQRTRSAL